MERPASPGSPPPARRARRDAPGSAEENAPQAASDAGARGGIEECQTSADLRAHLIGCKQILFFCFQLELAPSTGQRHFQGYVRTTNAITLVGVKRFLPTAHWEPAKGTEAQCIAYCSKEESRCPGEEPVMYGEVSEGQGKRKDLDRVREMVSTGCGMRQIVGEVQSYQGIKTAESLLKYMERQRNFKPEVRWYHGSTGSGKTRSAMNEFPDAWMSGRNLKWWEGYDAHEVVVIDDFRKDFCTFHEFLRILDRYPYRVEVKGGSRQLLARTMIVTCPWPPEVLYEGRSAEDIGQLLRRIDDIKLFGDPVPPPPAPSATAAHFIRGQ